MPHDQEFYDLGLACVMSAGWLPGVTELLPAYSLAVSKTRMDEIHSVTTYSGDSGEWSNSAMRDIVWYLRKFGRRRPKYIRNGKWVRAKLAEILIEKDMGDSIGRRLFAMSCLPEMEVLIGRLSCDGRAYAALPSAGPLCRQLPKLSSPRVVWPASCCLQSHNCKDADRCLLVMQKGCRVVYEFAGCRAAISSRFLVFSSALYATSFLSTATGTCTSSSNRER